MVRGDYLWIYIIANRSMNLHVQLNEPKFYGWVYLASSRVSLGYNICSVVS